MKYRSDKHRLPPFSDSGILLVDKPAGWTSFDVVNFIRSRFNIPKVGHCGTLDPAATGLLIIVLGKFTVLSQKFSGQDKCYDATILLGKESDSQDMDGTITAEAGCENVTPEAFTKTALSFQGEIMQIPPMVSAVKKDGKRLYELARNGEEVDREPRKVTIRKIELGDINLPFANFRVLCSKGTYVRTLCADIGQVLGCGGLLYQLRRVSSGSFSIDDALSIDTLKQWEQPELSSHVRDFIHNKLAAMKDFSF